MSVMAATPVCVGIDVAQAYLDVALRPSGVHDRWPNDELGIAQVVEHLQAVAPALVVLAAPGGLEVPLTAALAVAGLPVAGVTPRQARDFAQAIGHLAKTDALDAHLLARCAEAVRPPPRAVPDAAAQARSALLTRRRQSLGTLVAEPQRRPTTLPALRPRGEAPSLGCAPSVTPSTMSCTSKAARAPCGGRMTSCCAACLGAGRCCPPP